MAIERADEEAGASITSYPMSSRRFWGALIACLAGIVVLFALGTWQVERLQWKNGLMSRIDARMHADPVDLAALEQEYEETGDVDYIPVSVSGRFLNEGERYFLSTFEGEAGWNVYTPFLTRQDSLVFVNRGFVPYDMRDPAKRREGLPDGDVTVTGLARNAPDEKPGYFVPDNDPAKDTFYWRNLDEMAAGLTLQSGTELLPFFIDAGAGKAPGGWPVGGTTVVDIPNNHLQYAFTWYGLGVVLLVMTVMLVLRRRKTSSEQAATPTVR